MRRIQPQRPWGTWPRGGDPYPARHRPRNGLVTEGLCAATLRGRTELLGSPNGPASMAPEPAHLPGTQSPLPNVPCALLFRLPVRSRDSCTNTWRLLGSCRTQMPGSAPCSLPHRAASECVSGSLAGGGGAPRCSWGVKPWGIGTAEQAGWLCPQGCLCLCHTQVSVCDCCACLGAMSRWLEGDNVGVSFFSTPGLSGSGLLV